MAVPQVCRPIVAFGDQQGTCGDLSHILSGRASTLSNYSLSDFDAISRLPDHSTVIVITSALKAPGALALVRAIRLERPQTPVVFVASASSEELVISALRAGVNDYLASPYSRQEFERIIERMERLNDEASKKGCKTLYPEEKRGAVNFLGENPVIRKIREHVLQIAPPSSGVLITGETGTGKEVVAGLIHRHSNRRSHNFVCLNCAAIPDTLLESELFGYERGAFTGAVKSNDGKLKLADHGTLFLDEIGDMSAAAQAKLLRVVEGCHFQRLGSCHDISVDLRIIAATNQLLEDLTLAGKFRSDLFFRIKVAHIHLPPLRERKEDIPVLAQHFIKEFRAKFARHAVDFTPSSHDLLRLHNWPGNVRELRNIVEASFLCMPASAGPFLEVPEPFCRTVEQCAKAQPDEIARMLSALYATHWNKSKAAKDLNWSRMTLYRKMRKHQLSS